MTTDELHVEHLDGDDGPLAVVELLRHRVDDLSGRVRRMESHAADVDGDHYPHDVPVEPLFPDVEAWVTYWFVPVFARSASNEVRWCGQWWAHGEAITRLTALWHAWETLRLDPGLGMGTWFRDHLDPQLRELVAPRGPFARCTPDRHEASKPLPTTPAPDGHWDTEGVVNAQA